MTADAPNTRPALTGGCMCGSVRWAVHAAPEAASYCHCTRCQRRTGTAWSVGARIAPGSFELLSGQEEIREWRPAEGYVKCFCGTCGSQLWSRDPADPDAISLRMGGFDDDPGIRPSYRQFVDDAAGWEPIPDDGLPRYGGRAPADRRGR